MAKSNTPSDRGGDLPENILEIRDASVTFDLSRGVSRVLDGVDLDIKRDEVLGVVGESGSGKSMLANALVDAVPEEGDLDGSIRYYPPSGEEIEILDQDAEGLRRLRWEEISIVSQSALSSFNPTMKIRTPTTTCWRGWSGPASSWRTSISPPSACSIRTRTNSAAGCASARSSH
jgi:peptide/nickel transport system ATP-binding protein